MRTKFLTLVALLVAGAVRADVVIESPDSGTGSSVNGTFTISWAQAATSATLSTFKLYDGSSDTISFVLRRSTGGAYSDVGSNLNVSGTNDFTFTTGISNAALSAGNYQLVITTYLDAGYHFSATDTSGTGPWANAYGFSSVASTAMTGGKFINYQLSAVPEPGTMLLGGIAAAVGGAGAWWKRRKQRLAAAEAAATPA